MEAINAKLTEEKLKRIIVNIENTKRKIESVNTDEIKKTINLIKGERNLGNPISRRHDARIVKLLEELMKGREELDLVTKKLNRFRTEITNAVLTDITGIPDSYLRSINKRRKKK